MGSGTVDIVIQLNNTDGYKYKPLDVIRGRVNLKVHKEISVKEVTVKFAGISRSEFQVNERRRTANGNTQNRKVTKTEFHTVAYDEGIIFPPPNVRNVSNSKEFTLTPGEYVYDFAFKIPLRNVCYLTNTGGRGVTHGDTRLPPSMGITGIGNINYQVRVTVKRASWFKSNPQEHKNPMVTSFDPIDDIISHTHPFFLRNSIVFSDKIHKRIALTEKPTGPESYEIPIKESARKKSSHFIKSLFGNKGPPPKFAQEYDVPFVFEVRCSTPFLRIGRVPQLKIFLTSKHGPERYRGIDNQTSGLGQFILEDFGIYLIGTYSVIAEGRSVQEQRIYRLNHKRDLSMELDLANLEPNPLHGTTADSNPFQLELPFSLYGDAVVLDVVKPTFDTCNIKVDYKLNIWAKFLEEKKSWGSKKLEFLTPVTVLTGVPAPQEYIQMMQIPPQLAQQVLETYPPEAFRQPDDFTPLYDDTTAAPISLNVEEPEPAKQNEKQNLTEQYSPAQHPEPAKQNEKQKLAEHYSQAQNAEEILPTYGSATKEQ
ncbi:hypothetical protein BN7_6572 [Wickerhamomyces ciferrii]|uniref:Arrestin-like N-terminal domain-containing protein n=1 Tax=Wickerhamomyces ciferrii (strain ATCC 14091 / BCRC 22168 / CBS 111 / JCM 3599 / NBRC 0793 / NRRL Y-1031 F-60-10) TaxID=1206466 RepID=K0KNW2_WICCF|nr:uncharacterized protein BN7_6572 [Wickerhamomyces ciferrii]CCH46965.1 hypothetical protein BN7_6572 [Wickerhamomyces ciferrii]